MCWAENQERGGGSSLFRRFGGEKFRGVAPASVLVGGDQKTYGSKLLKGKKGNERVAQTKTERGKTMGVKKAAKTPRTFPRDNR